MPDELLKNLLVAADNLIEDMRRRAKMRGDVEIEDGKEYVVLDCGNSVLFGIDDARAAARKYLEEKDNASKPDTP